MKGLPKWWGMYGFGCGSQASMGERLAQGICVPQHMMATGREPANFLIPGARGVECCGVLDTLLCPPSPNSPGGWWGPSPARGCGDEGPLWQGWGPASEGYCCQEGGLNGGLFCVSLGCWGCWYFGSLNSSDLGGSRPWQGLNSYCPFSSPAEWEAGWPRWAGGTPGIPTPPPGD